MERMLRMVVSLLLSGRSLKSSGPEIGILGRTQSDDGSSRLAVTFVPESGVSFERGGPPMMQPSMKRTGALALVNKDAIDLVVDGETAFISMK